MLFKYHWIGVLIVIIYLILQINGAVESAILDSRCYLEGGGSAESFLANEDLEVGAVIGTLRINGDPDIENGDVHLSLREKDSPVRIITGTKELALSIELDKEGLRGPSSIYVNVICMRRHSTDPSFVIPVNVRVIDVNDNAPKWIGAPYTLTLSEVTVPGTRILQGAHAEDADQQGPFSTVEYQVLPGPFSDNVKFLNPLEGTLVLKQPLDYETLQNFTVELRAQDQGSPPKFSDTLLRVIVTDADDQNPKFLRESYTAELPADGRVGELRIRPEPLQAVDQDEGLCAPIQYSIVQSQDAKYFRIHPHNGVITLLTPLGYTDAMNGVTLVIKGTQIDNPDRYALTTVTLARPGSQNEMTILSFVQKKFFMRIREDTTVGNRILALPTNKPGKHLTYTIPDPVNSQFFSVGSLGELILMKPLDYEKMTRHDFQVFVTDGVTNSTAEVTLEVTDVNDWEPRFRETHYEFMVPKSVSLNSQADSFEGIMVGKVEAADGDRNDHLDLSLRGHHAGLFEIDANGNIYMRPEQMKYLNESTIHLVAIATDSGVPPRSTSVPISVTMEGLSMAQVSWTSNLWSMFGMVVGVFLLIILALTCIVAHSKEIRKQRKAPKLGRNRVHNHTHKAVSSVNLMTHEKVKGNGNGKTASSLSSGSRAGGVGVGFSQGVVGGGSGVAILHSRMKNSSNVKISNALTNGVHLNGSGSSLSAGASTILAASLEREAQRERERENYAATVRSIVSRASANGQLYDDDNHIEHDSLPNIPDTTIAEVCNRKTAWVASGHSPSHSHPQLGAVGVTTSGATFGNMLAASAEDVTSSENNLTVYF